MTLILSLSEDLNSNTMSLCRVHFSYYYYYFFHHRRKRDVYSAIVRSVMLLPHAGATVGFRLFYDSVCGHGPLSSFSLFFSSLLLKQITSVEGSRAATKFFYPSSIMTGRDGVEKNRKFCQPVPTAHINRIASIGATNRVILSVEGYWMLMKGFSQQNIFRIIRSIIITPSHI